MSICFLVAQRLQWDLVYLSILCANGIPFRAGVLTQGAGHFPEVIENHSFERPLLGVIQKAAQVRP